MPSASSSPNIWVFTEHFNATYLINFLYPSQAMQGGAGYRLESWSAAGLVDTEWDQLETQLRGRMASNPPDAVIYSRYVNPFGKQLQALFRSAGVEQFFHLDDLLYAVPDSLGRKYRDTYSDAFVAQMHSFIEGCDGVLASTPALAAQIRSRHPTRSVQTLLGVCYMEAATWPIAPLRSRIARGARRLSRLGAPTIGYMGSASHQRDLETILPTLVQLLRADPRLRFETLGIAMPGVLKEEFGPRVQHYGFTSDYLGFLRALYELGWDLGLAPLVNDEFNAAKTATKYVEYTACGVVTVAQNIAPYATLPDGALYTADNSTWEATVQTALADAGARRKALDHAKTVCRSTFSAHASVGQLLSRIHGVPTGHSH